MESRAPAPAPATPPVAVPRGTPWIGAALVLGGLGALVWTLSGARPKGTGAVGGGTEVEIARGEPIRAPVARPERPEAAPAPPRTIDGFEEVQFAQLSGFDYPKSGSLTPLLPGEGATTTPPAAGGEPASAAPPPSKLPPAVRALDGRRVTITGFMNPLDFDTEGVKAFALTAIPGGCCYGAIPRLNEWVVVTMPGEERAEYAYYDPVTIYGTLSVGELYEDGIVLSLYRMTPEQVDIGY